MSNKVKSDKERYFLYRCNTCRDIIVVQSRCDETIPFSILCFATPKCKGRMLQVKETVKLTLQSSVYFYIWVMDYNNVLSLIEMPGRPRFKYLHTAMQRMFSEQRKKNDTKRI